MMDTEKEFERLIRDRALLMVLIGKGAIAFFSRSLWHDESDSEALLR
jgi:hypothetical protein